MDLGVTSSTFGQVDELANTESENNEINYTDFKHKYETRCITIVLLPMLMQ